MKILMCFLLCLFPFCFSVSRAAEGGFVGEPEKTNASASVLAEEIKAAPCRTVVIAGPREKAELLSAELAASEDLEASDIETARTFLKKRGISSYSGARAAKCFPDACLYFVAHPGTQDKLSVYDTKTGLLLAEIIDGDPLSRIQTVADQYKNTPPSAQFTPTGNFASLPPAASSVARSILERLRTRLARTGAFPMDEQAWTFGPENAGQGNALFNTCMEMNFTAGKTPDTVDLAVKVRSFSGIELLSKTYPGIRDGDALFRDLCALSKVEPSSAPDFAAEIRRLHEEYSSLCEENETSGETALPEDYEPLLRLASTLLLLEPGNPRNHYEWLFLNLCRVYDSRLAPSKKVGVLKSFLADAQNFRKTFASYRFPLDQWGEIHTFDKHPVLTVLPFLKPAGGGDYTRALAECTAWNADLRKSLTEKVKIVNSSVRTKEDFLKKQGEIRGKIASMRRSKPEEEVRVRFEGELAELSAALELAKNNPKLPLTVPDRQYFPYERSSTAVVSPGTWTELRKIMRAEYAKLDAVLAAFKMPETEARRNELQALRDYLNSDGSMQALRRVYAKKLDHMFRSGLLLRPRGVYSGYLADAVQASTRPGTPARTEQLNFLMTYPFELAYERADQPLAVKQLCLLECAARNPRWIKENASSIRAMAYSGMTQKNTANTLESLARDLYADLANPDAASAIEELNSSFTMRRVPLPGEICLASREANGKAFLLMKNKANLLVLAEYDPLSGTVTDCDMPPVLYSDFQNLKNAAGQPDPCTLSSFGDFLFAGGAKSLVVWNVRTKQWTILRELPAAHPACAAIVNGKLFILCGGQPGMRGSDKFLSMHSCKPDGTEMKTYFNGGAPGTHPLDRLRSGRVCGFFPAPSGKLLFCVNSINHFADIYEFTPKNETFRQVGSFPMKTRLLTMRVNGDVLLGQAGIGDGPTFFTFTAAKPFPVWFFTQSPDDKHSVRARIDGFGALQMPAVLAEDRYLASVGSHIPLILDLADPKKSPFLFLPESGNVMYFPARREYVFPAKHDGALYAVKLK